MRKCWLAGRSALILVSMPLLALVGCTPMSGESPATATREPESTSDRSLQQERSPANVTAEEPHKPSIVPGVPMLAAESPQLAASGVQAAARLVPMARGVHPQAVEGASSVTATAERASQQASTPEELREAFEMARQAIDGLAEQYPSDADYPQTASFLFEKKLELFVDAIKQEVPGAREEFDDYVALLVEQDPQSEQTATAVGTHLYALRILPGDPTAEKEALIGDFLEAYPAKAYGGKLVLMYGALLQRAQGPESRLNWFAQHVGHVAGPDAEEIAKALAQSTAIGSVAELSGPTLDGSEFDLEDLRGKVVLIDFWATWCGPCIAELPEVKRVYDEFRERGFEVVGFSLDRSQEPIETFLESKDYDWTQVYVSDQELRNEVTKRFGVSGIPALYLVNPQGTIIALNLRGYEQISHEVAKALGDEADRPAAETSPAE